MSNFIFQARAEEAHRYAVIKGDTVVTVIVASPEYVQKLSQEDGLLYVLSDDAQINDIYNGKDFTRTIEIPPVISEYDIQDFLTELEGLINKIKGRI